jgi:hypothetical protein
MSRICACESENLKIVHICLLKETSVSFIVPIRKKEIEGLDLHPLDKITGRQYNKMKPKNGW